MFWGDALDGETNKHLATTDRHRVGQALDRKTNKKLIWLVGGQTETEGGDAPEGKTNKY